MKRNFKLIYSILYKRTFGNGWKGRVSYSLHTTKENAEKRYKQLVKDYSIKGICKVEFINIVEL